MTLTKEEKKDIITYRTEKAFQTFKEAADNASLHHWSLSANRLYYAIFYMVLAINLKNGDYTKTHTGTYNLFYKRYVASGILSKEEGKLYRHLFSMRQSGDYDDLFDWQEEDIVPIMPEVEKLLLKMKRIVEE
ncbi:MAG: HEPN domain-containing protein [Muribaculaceae bacterium]|nr:HEPN domain-containing protein [Muribaculaceae bacterium]